MKVFLIKDVPNLGLTGEIKEVKNGYAWNWLIPQKLARPANRADFYQAEELKTKRQEEQKKQEELSKELALKINQLQIEFSLKTTKTGKVFGSVTGDDVLKGLLKQGIELKRENIKLEKPLKEIGERKIEISLPAAQTANLKIKIVPKANN